MNPCSNCGLDMTQEGVQCSVCSFGLHVDCSIKEDGKDYCDSCYVLRTEEPEKIQFEIPDSIRRTYIELYRSCPHKFLKEVIEGNEAPETCYTRIGIDLHDLFEKGLVDRSYNIEQMKSEYQVIWDDTYPELDLFDSEKQQEDMYQRSQDSIDTFHSVIDSIPIPIMTEEKIRFSIGEDIPDIEFTMDAVIEQDGELELLDWKTGRVMVGQKLSTDLQAPLYIHGVQQKLGRTVKKFTFYYLKENKVRVFYHTHGDEYVCEVGKRKYYINTQEAIKEVKRMFSQINKGNFNIPSDTKSMYFTCKMCHIREQGLCEGAEAQAWNNVW